MKTEKLLYKDRIQFSDSVPIKNKKNPPFKVLDFECVTTFQIQIEVKVALYKHLTGF